MPGVLPALGEAAEYGTGVGAFKGKIVGQGERVGQHIVLVAKQLDFAPRGIAANVFIDTVPPEVDLPDRAVHQGLRLQLQQAA